MHRYGLLALALLPLAACSDPSDRTPPTEILCAAEALHLARNAATRGEEDRLRAKSDLFTKKLPLGERQRLWSQVDLLSDRRGARPLVDAATCEGLLTAEDRRKLSAAKTQEATVHDNAIGNGQ